MEQGAMVEPTACAVQMTKVGGVRANQNICRVWVWSDRGFVSSGLEGVWSKDCHRGRYQPKSTGLCTNFRRGRGVSTTEKARGLSTERPGME